MIHLITYIIKREIIKQTNKVLRIFVLLLWHDYKFVYFVFSEMLESLKVRFT